MKKIKLALLIGAIGLSSLSIDVKAEEDYHSYLPAICEEYGVSECLMEALILTESTGRTDVVSTSGAIGLCQIQPQYHQERMARLGVTDLYDAESNILVAVDYIMELATKYGDVYLVLTAYNAGEYSKTFQRVLNGGSSAYADKVLALSHELEVERYGG